MRVSKDNSSKKIPRLYLYHLKEQKNYMLKVLQIMYTLIIIKGWKNSYFCRRLHVPYLQAAINSKTKKYNQ